jgi:hypothetical protein
MLPPKVVDRACAHTPPPRHPSTWPRGLPRAAFLRTLIMTSDDASEHPEGVRGYVRFSAKLARAICERIAAGETQLAICADPGMPSRNTLRR